MNLEYIMIALMCITSILIAIAVVCGGNPVLSLVIVLLCMLYGMIGLKLSGL